MIGLVSLIVLLRRLLVPTVFRMVHPYMGAAARSSLVSES